jgi:hypothetical protein
MHRYLPFVVAALLSIPMLRAADTAEVPELEKPRVEQTLDTFNEWAADIHTRMQVGGVYEHISAADRARLDIELGEMLKLLQARSSQNDMSQDEKIALFNTQGEVIGILHHNNNNRLVCEKRAPVGSHVPVTFCRTFGEIMDEQKLKGKAMRDFDVLNQPFGKGLPAAPCTASGKTSAPCPGGH